MPRTTCAASTSSRSSARSPLATSATSTPTCPPVRSRSWPRLIEVLNASAPLPFQVDERVTVGEEARLKHRYLDLRRPGTHSAGHAIRLRSKVSAAARRVLEARDFVEIETPTLTRSTPEGARDFLVPARLAPGSWYALPQSPQLFKQLLMVAGMERYYQIARCYRDEDFRADRQPEFTQLDIEMSFVEQADVLELGEAIVREIWELIGVELHTPFPQMTYAEAMKRYGTDKPDLRFGRRARRVHRLLRRHPVPGVPERVRRRGRHARRREPAPQAARRLAGVGQAARRPRPGLRAGAGRRHPHRPGRQEPVRDRAGRPGRARRRARPATASSSRPAPRRPRAPCSGPPGSRSAGAASSSTSRPGASSGSIDAPLFEPAADAVAAGDVAVGAGAWTAVHHAFTSPKAEFLDTFDTDPGPALAYAYDMVCNGNEIGGGSIRIHRRDVQERVFKVMGLSRGGRPGEVRLPARRVPVRRPAARRHRLRLGPHRHAARRLRVDPRRHRLPEVRRRLRPADRRPGADHARSSARRPASTAAPRHPGRRPDAPRPPAAPQLSRPIRNLHLRTGTVAVRR